MPRPGRYFLPGLPLHVIQRGNNRQAVFFTDADRSLYLRWLAEAASANGLAIHGYVLMTNHVHLLATPGGADSLPRSMQSLGRRYVRHVNAAYRRSGTLWEGRYRAAPIEAETYLLACLRYIELNPVRAGMVGAPAAWPWSSHRALAEGAADPLLAEHALYTALGPDPAARRAAWRALFAEVLPASFVDELRAATNSGWACGSERFRREIGAALARRVEPLPRGRPRKTAEDILL